MVTSLVGFCAHFVPNLTTKPSLYMLSH